ncbi:hypothetical protein ACFFMN_28030, partial [Planobispora siamensis]
PAHGGLIPAPAGGPSLIPAPAGDPGLTPASAPVPASQPESPPALVPVGRAGGPRSRAEGVATSVALASLPSDADRIRTALTVLGADAAPAQVIDWLRDHGVSVAPANVKSVTRRERARRAQAESLGRVVSLTTRRTEP